MIDRSKLEEVGHLLSSFEIPAPIEPTAPSFLASWEAGRLAQLFVLAVAICHQTSPRNEPAYEGLADGARRRGWDLLLCRLAYAAQERPEVLCPQYWHEAELEAWQTVLTKTDDVGQLSRMEERVELIKDIGKTLCSLNLADVKSVLDQSGGTFFGEENLEGVLLKTRAFGDPVRKKLNFLAVLLHEHAELKLADADQIGPPVDYHEIRGLLRLGVIRHISGERFSESHFHDWSEDADIRLRSECLGALSELSQLASVPASHLHYYLWNLFRNCCPRESARTHCAECANCGLPADYRLGAESRCALSIVCASSNAKERVIEPTYAGHFY